MYRTNIFFSQDSQKYYRRGVTVAMSVEKAQGIYVI
jgi:hypothetical protein